jgi:asparagine synthase (glutamine-hydrolysing)
MHDEPLSHPNAVAMHCVFKLARHDAGIPVLLSGEGADEVFGGYDWYRAVYRREQLQRIFGARLTSTLLRMSFRGSVRDLANPDFMMLINALGRDRQLTNLPAVREAVHRRAAEFGGGQVGTDGMFRYDQVTYLQPLLQRQDRMSMAVGLEARVPFLDHPLVEWANALRASVKLGKGQPKRLLREMGVPYLPAEIIHRRKVGFTLPLAEWLRGPLRGQLELIRTRHSLASTLVAPDVINRMLEDHGRGERNCATVLWTLLALEIWKERFFTWSPESSTKLAHA